MGINADLHLSGNDFSNASTAFFIAYLIAEVPNGESQNTSVHKVLAHGLNRLSSTESTSRQMARV